MTLRSTTLITSVFLILLLLAVPHQGEAQSQLGKKQSDQLALQLFLDGENFGPGRVDGKWGEFTAKALTRWNNAHPDRKVEMLEGQPNPGSGNELWGDRPLLTHYNLTKEDFDSVGILPEEPEEKGKLESLPYESVLEMVSEKFRADHDFIKELNPGVSWESASAGQTVTVPNVKTPFSLVSVKPETSDEASSTGDSPSKSATVLLSREIVEVREGDELIASFPISVGQQGNETPSGDWQVDVIQWMPEFRYDEKMLEQGVRSDKATMLPPGPNSPVGIVWIGLNADGIGLHGTDNPHDIGRNNSSGCIRLSNWDAKTLGEMLKVNTAVTVVK